LVFQNCQVVLTVPFIVSFPGLGRLGSSSRALSYEVSFRKGAGGAPVWEAVLATVKTFEGTFCLPLNQIDVVVLGSEDADLKAV
jgi:hypothetical protein